VLFEPFCPVDTVLLFTVFTVLYLCRRIKYPFIQALHSALCTDSFSINADAVMLLHDNSAAKYTHTHTHTHTHKFSGPFSRTTQVSRYQKSKTNLDSTEARDSEWQWHQLGYMQVCTSLQTDNHASTPPLSFLQAGCPSFRPTNSVKALKVKYSQIHSSLITFHQLLVY